MSVQRYFYERPDRPIWFVPGGGSYNPEKDGRPLMPRRGPVRRAILTMAAPGEQCTSCARRIEVDERFFRTRQGRARHEQCGLQG